LFDEDQKVKKYEKGEANQILAHRDGEWLVIVVW